MRIYMNKNSTRNRRIDQMFKKITNPNKNKVKNDITNIYDEKANDLVNDNIGRKRMRDETENNEDDLHRVSSKSPRLTNPPPII